MTETMYIGSGDCTALLRGKNTLSHIGLMQRFVSGVKPYYNALASPIDPLRTGVILEQRYCLLLPDNYYSQYILTCQEMDVFRSSLDFACVEDGAIVDFDELKCINFNDFIHLLPLVNNPERLLQHVKRTYKSHYAQVQFQLLCAGLDSANLVYLCVKSYNDAENWARCIRPEDIVKIRIHRDEDVIRKIIERGQIFQSIKDFYTK